MDGIIGIVIIVVVLVIIVYCAVTSSVSVPDYKIELSKPKTVRTTGSKEKCPLCGTTAAYGEVHPDCHCHDWYEEDMRLGILPPGVKELSYGSWLLLRLVDKDLEAGKITLGEAKTRTKKIIENAKTEKTRLNRYRRSQRQRAAQSMAEKRSRYLY